MFQDAVEREEGLGRLACSPGVRRKDRGGRRSSGDGAMVNGTAARAREDGVAVVDGGRGPC